MARVAKKAVVKKGAVKKAANKSVRKTSARNPVATLTKSHAAAEKKVVAAQKKLDKLTAAREKITVKLTANWEGSYPHFKMEFRQTVRVFPFFQRKIISQLIYG